MTEAFGRLNLDEHKQRLNRIMADIQYAERGTIYANAGGLIALLGLVDKGSHIFLLTLWSFGLGLAIGGFNLFFSPMESMVHWKVAEDIRTAQTKIDELVRLEPKEENLPAYTKLHQEIGDLCGAFESKYLPMIERVSVLKSSYLILASPLFFLLGLISGLIAVTVR